jgi:hypothetical protein
LEAPDAATEMSSTDASIVSPVGSPASSTTSISDPDAPAPAAEGRPWKYSGRENVWPSRSDPTISPSLRTSDPSASSENARWARPVTTSG